MPTSVDMDEERVTAERPSPGRDALDEARAFFGWCWSLSTEADEAAASGSTAPATDWRVRAALRAAANAAPLAWRGASPAYVAPSMLAGLDWVGDDAGPSWGHVAPRMRRAIAALDRALVRLRDIGASVPDAMRQQASRAVEAVSVVADSGRQTLDTFGERAASVGRSLGIGLALAGVGLLAMMARRH